MPPELGGTPVEAERGQASADGDATSASAVRARLEEQIAWYDANSEKNQHRFKELKICQIVVAAAIPVAAATSAPVWLMGGGGALIVVVEGLQQLQQYQQNWTAYRSTCERLKHEKFLYLARAGPYATASNRESLLAARVEGLVSQEHAAWVSHQHEETTKETGAE